MTINYGKREAGGLTAASPGDTLYIPYATYNDSGASINDTGLVVADIKVFKNGGVVARATDSGIHLGDTGTAGDTGQYGDNIGLSRISLRIYNTADDTGFYDAGSQYHVAITGGLSIDAREVNFFPAVFEVGRQILDTGIINQAVWTADGSRLLTAGTNLDFGVHDTGIRTLLADFDTGLRDLIAEHDTGVKADIAGISVTVDTGVINQAVWTADASRVLTGGGDVDFAAQDTGVRKILVDMEFSLQVHQNRSDTGIKSTIVNYAGDTGLRQLMDDYDTGTKNRLDRADTGKMHDMMNVGTVDFAAQDTGIRTLLEDHDTGVKSRFDNMAEDTGGVNVTAIAGDTGSATVLSRFAADTGQLGRLAKFGALLSDAGQIDDGTVAVDFAAQDTGVRQLLADYDTGMRSHSDHSDTGVKSIIAQEGSDTGLRQLLDDYDTGMRSHVDHSDTGVKQQIVDYTTDTGVKQELDRLDTGISIHIDHLDTGIKSRFDNLAEDTGGVNLTTLDGDTGSVERMLKFFGGRGDDHAAVEDTGHLTDYALANLDTGIQQNTINYTTDTGLRDLIGDIDTGLRGHMDHSDTGVKQQTVDYATDTGLRTLLADYDTGMRDTLADLDTGVRSHIDHTDTGIRKALDHHDTGVKNRFDAMIEDTGGVNLTSIMGDTGHASRLGKYAGVLDGDGKIAVTTLEGTQTGTIDANITFINETQVAGSGDTGTGDTWGPA